MEVVRKNINEEIFVDVYSFDKLLPKKSRYNLLQSINKIVDILEDNNIAYAEIKEYIHALVDQSFKLGNKEVFSDY